MNPYVIRVADEYHLYYAGAAEDGFRRICLATASVTDPGSWTRHGVVLDHGAAGDFDYKWVVLPHVVQVGEGRWHLYYTSNCGSGSGLDAFRGLGVAVSADGKIWEKYAGNPVIAPTGRAADPDACGIAGGAVLNVNLAGGGTEWRYYYTGCPTVGDDFFRHQQKICCYAASQDGLHWERRGPVMFRDPGRDYVDVAAAGPVVRQEPDGTFRMWFSAIGTRWGAYSICYAESDDGIEWCRGAHYGDDLQLGPSRRSWEWEMVEYPSVIDEGGRQRLFYCGNGYGRTGIGTAVSTPLRAMATKGPCLLRVVASETVAGWDYRMPEGLQCAEGVFKTHAHPVVDWHGPTADGMLWHEWRTSEADLDILRSYSQAEKLGLSFIGGIEYRVIVNHVERGLDVTLTARNIGEQTLHNVTAFPCLGHPSDGFADELLERTFIVTGAGLTPLSDTDRGSGDPVRTHYHVRGGQPQVFYGPSYWGEPSATVAEQGAVIRTDASGRFSVGCTWESVSEIYNNEDAHHCIHSVPSLGDIDVGETKTVKGRIVLVEGGADAALALLEFSG